jgi:PKD repeat protein
MVPTRAQSVTLAWSPSPSPAVAGYELCYGLADGQYTWTLDAGTNTTFKVTGLTPGLTYYFAVAAYNSAGDVSPSSNVLFNGIPTIPAFAATPTNGGAPLTVTFTDASTGAVTNWFWDFGDGGTSNTSTTNSLAHTYNTPGVYTVTETVTGPSGMTAITQTNLINVMTPFEAWQFQYFGCTTCPQAQSGANFDGTGQNNYYKYVAGLDPTDTNSIFVLSLAPVPKQPGWMNLVFSPVVAGRTYTALVSSNLLNDTWIPLAGAPAVTNGTQVTLTDTNASGAQKFYQIKISLP